jgi:uncharacterized membrane protein YfcA
MQIDPFIVLGSAVVGLLVGLTGAGGGALMTPMLILLFGVKPSSAISSDLVAAVLMRPVGAAVHAYKRTVNFRLVGWMVAGSVPMAFVGAYLLHQLGESSAAQKNVEMFLGAALLIGAAAMVFRYVLDRRSGQRRIGTITEVTVRPLPTIAIGMIGGLIVGMTSVGSGSLMIVLLLFIYPRLAAGQLVGTDLTQAVPLTAAAALGALIFGHVEFGVTFSIILGSVPAVLIGAFLSSRAPDRYIRPIITFVIFASGLKYVGVATTVLGWILCAVALAGGGYWLARVQPWRNGTGRLTLATAGQAGESPPGAPGAASANGATSANVATSGNGAARANVGTSENGAASGNGTTGATGAASANGATGATGTNGQRATTGAPPVGIDEPFGFPPS